MEACLTCMSCLGLLQEPSTCTPCGHTFCSSCLEASGGACTECDDGHGPVLKVAHGSGASPCPFRCPLPACQLPSRSGLPPSSHGSHRHRHPTPPCPPRASWPAGRHALDSHLQVRVPEADARGADGVGDDGQRCQQICGDLETFVGERQGGRRMTGVP